MGTNLSLSVKLFLSWILVLTLFVLLGGILFGGLNSLSFYDLANWDGRHFLEIAQKGYLNKIQYAFFPLYPVLIRFLGDFLRVDYLYSALVINFTAVFGIIYLFLRLLEHYGEKKTAKTLIYFLVFPTSFYLICTYSESLFLFLTLLTFLLAKKKKYSLAALFASLSSITRITGIAVITALLIDVFLSKTNRGEKIAAVFFSFSALIIYCTYLYIKTGNPFYFLISELSWDRSIDIPGSNIWTSVQYIAYFGLKPESYTILSDLFFATFGLGMAVRSARFLKPPMAVYTLISLLLPLTTNLLLSIPRFLIVIFPIFILTAKIKSNVFQIGYMIISLVMLFLFINFFLRNIWVS